MTNRWLSAVLGTLMVLTTLIAVPASPATAALAQVQVVTGSQHTCALAPSGQAYCWGSNNNGQLGDNTTTDRSTPVAVQQGAVTFTSITGGGYHTCGLTSAGAAYCWGLNNAGQLGDGTTTDRSTPVAVQQGAVTFTSITGGSYHTCGLTGAGAAYCWGYNGFGQLGDNTTTDRPTPTAVQQGAVTFTSMTAGSQHTCGLTGAGAAYCWGANWDGQLGDNTTTDRPTPTAVQQGAVTFTSMTAGGGHTCGLTGAGAAYCWGNNANGRLGDNTTTDRYTLVGVQQGAVTFTSMTAGGGHTCGLTGAGAAYCWGLNGNGQLGDTTTTERHTPVAVNGGLSWETLVASESAEHTCAVKASSQLIYCWGENADLQLGDNTTTDRSSPVQAWYLVTAGEITVTATIDAELTFTVSAHSGSCNGVAQTAGASASASSVALGRANATTNVIGAQDLAVVTNAANGFTVFARSSGSPGDGNGHTIADVSGTNAAPGSFPSAGTAAFGYTTSESALGTGTANRFTDGGAQWAAFTTSNAEVSYATAPTDHTVCLAYQLGVGATTPAGSYSTTVIYTALPRY